jgi:sulfur-carrier protein
VIRIALPFHLRNLAKVQGEVQMDGFDPAQAITIADVLDALEEKYPMLRGTIRDHVTKERRPFLRYYACNKDFSLHSTDTPLPEAVVRGEEPFIVLGSIAGG